MSLLAVQINMEQFITPYAAAATLPGSCFAVLAPHPDDEVFGCGGTLAALVKAGARVRVLILTDGTGWGSAEDLARTRREESIRAGQVLGYGTPEFWGLQDGELSRVPDLGQRIAQWVTEVGADVVVAPSIWEMHRDHRACAEAACKAVQSLPHPIRLAMYEVGVPLHPNVLVDVSTTWPSKEAAMACFQTQLSLQDYARHITGLNQFRTYSLPSSVKAAEAFCVLQAGELAGLLAAAQPFTQTVALMEADKRTTELGAEIQALQREQFAMRVQHKTALDQVEAELRRKEGERQQLQEILTGILNSQSWRLTKPLRLLNAVRRGEISASQLLYRTFRALALSAPVPDTWKHWLRERNYRVKQALTSAAESRNNSVNAQRLLTHRYESLDKGVSQIRGGASLVEPVPQVDISLVTFNSQRWLDGLLGSLISQAYPLDKLALYVTDNGSTDQTTECLERFAADHGHRFREIRLLKSPNRGFGAGHNLSIGQGQAPFVLVTNPDLEFDGESIRRVVAQALRDAPDTASWELQQRPYEHPKHYDPVTRETSWSSHACILIRRDAFVAVGGYDERIFLYGEDVEFSFRLRARGWVLRYCPDASVQHFSYSEPGEVKPAQYLGSICANFYLRARYGSWRDLGIVPVLAFRALVRSPFPGARRKLLSRLARDFLPHLPSLLRERSRDIVRGVSPFRGYNYELSRTGAFTPTGEMPQDKPLVSVVTRTVAGRSKLLQQAGLSVLQQTYPAIEWIVVEDGGDAQKDVVDRLASLSSYAVRYASLPKVGRSAAGNHGMRMASGRWVMFLDDDDLLYADHVACLVHALLDAPEAVAAYSLAWEVPSRKRPDETMEEGSYLLHTAHQQPFDYAKLREMNYIPIQAILFEKDLFLKRGGFDEEIEFLEDWHLWQRYAHQNRFVYVPKVTSLYRVPADFDVRAGRQRQLDEAYPGVKQKAAEAIGTITDGSFR